MKYLDGVHEIVDGARDRCDRHPAVVFFFLMIRRPPRSTLFPSRRSSDLPTAAGPGDRVAGGVAGEGDGVKGAELPDSAEVGRDAGRLGRLGRIVGHEAVGDEQGQGRRRDRKSTRLNSSHTETSYAVFCFKKRKTAMIRINQPAAPLLLQDLSSLKPRDWMGPNDSHSGERRTVIAFAKQKSGRTLNIVVGT